jgi:hypothetical protein
MIRPPPAFHPRPPRPHGEHHRLPRDRHPLRIVMSHVDISPGLPRGHLVVPDKGPPNGGDGETAQQRQRPIDTVGVLTGLCPPARAHGQ